MAVPELGQIRIVPDFINYGIANSDTYSGGYEMLDHRTSSTYTVGSADNYLNISMASGRDKMFIGYGSTDNAYFIEYTSTRIHTGYTPVLNTTSTSLIDFGTSTDYCVSTLASGSSPTGFEIAGTKQIVHIGEIFELPHNASASLSYNTKHFNKVNTAIGGASYSTLYNSDSQRVISASWEYINWETGSSGIDDFTTMMGQCFGSHIPVALQLSQDPNSGSNTEITSEYFMFARITKWNQTQVSPTLWKVSAEFTEFI